MDELTEEAVVNTLKKLPALEFGNIRIVGSNEGYKKLGIEKLQEINYMLRGNRKDRRKAAALLRKVGLKVVARNDEGAEPDYASVKENSVDLAIVDELRDLAQQQGLYEAPENK